MRLAFLLLLYSLLSCSPKSDLDLILSTDQQQIRRVIDQARLYEVQILYSQINTDPAGNVSFTDYSFQLNDSHYFYPASTVKLPAALLALEFIQEDPFITLDAPYITARDSLDHTIADEFLFDP